MGITKKLTHAVKRRQQLCRIDDLLFPFSIFPLFPSSPLDRPNKLLPTDSMRQTQFKKHHLLHLIHITVLLLIASGCKQVGPTRVEAGRKNYNIAIQRTNDEQLLLNIVRLKYRDTPFFLEVSAVSSQFNVGASLDTSVSLPEGNSRSYGIGGAASFEETPTVSYSPLQGEDFIKRMMSPLSVESLLLLYHSGWSVERIFRVCLQRMNDLKNAPSASGPTPSVKPNFEEFAEVVDILRTLQKRGAVDLAKVTIEENTRLALVIDKDQLESAEVTELVQRLGLTPGLETYPITADLKERNPAEIQMQTRSLLGCLFYVSTGIEVPEKDIKQGKVTLTKEADGSPFDWNTFSEGLLKIKSGKTIQGDAAVAARYRDSWFYISDSDLNSKSTFSLLSQLFALQAGNVQTTTPVLTIPLGK